MRRRRKGEEEREVGSCGDENDANNGRKNFARRSGIPLLGGRCMRD